MEAVVEKRNLTIEKVDDIVFEKKPVYDTAKRLFDIFASLAAIIVLAIPMIIVAIAVKMDSSGPVVYAQERLTKDGRKFTLYKFRTMCENAEKNGAQWAEVNDCRITRLGSLLRKTRMDETLQFFNVLKGDMAIIGPRPEREIFHKDFCEKIEKWNDRLYVRQGITGLAQVTGGYDLMPQDKLVHDLEYIKNRSVWLDIKIMWKTVAIVFTHKGAR